ncbi:hypothetical protein GCM10023320_80810 [Pseudonocardia adelaidensis]|uniref:Uncharacterized protein n=1 Tax=Pseudonocardia adelaidensis TaxID=648754 RepID=A0ABP9P6F3_9PSEU
MCHVIGETVQPQSRRFGEWLKALVELHGPTDRAHDGPDGDERRSDRLSREAVAASRSGAGGHQDFVIHKDGFSLPFVGNRPRERVHFDSLSAAGAQSVGGC